MSFRRTLITTAVAFAVAITLAGCGTTSGNASAPPQTVTATQAAPTAAPQTVTAAPVTVTVTATPKPAAPTSEAPSTREAPSSSEVPTPAAGAAKLGEPVPYHSNRGYAVATLHSAEWTTDGGELDIPPEKGAYLVLDVAILVESGDPQGTNSFDWEAKDAEGRVYTPSFTAPDPQMHATDTAPGETTRGFLAFDMPKGTATVRLTSMVDGVLVSWVVK